MRLKGSKKGASRLIDRTVNDPDRAIYQQPSSAYPLTKGEYDMKDAGWSERDLYFLRAAQSEPDLSLTGGNYFSGYDDQQSNKGLQEMMFEKLMKAAYKKKRGLK